MLIPIRQILVLVFLAVAALGPATRLDAAESDDQFAVAAGHYDRQQWKLAVEEFRTFLRNIPRTAGRQSVFLLGEALLQSGRFDEARQQFHKLHRPRTRRANTLGPRVPNGRSGLLGGRLCDGQARSGGFLTKYPDDRLNAYVLPYLGDIALADGDAAAAAGTSATD